MVGLTLHSTHIIQPLDVTLMKPLKDYWTTKLNHDGVENPWERYHEKDVITMSCEPYKELRLQMEILESKRNQETAWRKLQQMRMKRGVLEAFTMDVEEEEDDEREEEE
eukprot:jgi/Tetstr1/465281/TSEL_009982.t1